MADRGERTRTTASEQQPAETHSAWSRPGFLLWHAILRWQRALVAALRPLGLTHVQFVLLGSVWWLERQGGAPSQAQLAGHAGTDVMMTSQVVRALETRGLLERLVDDHDARIRRVRTTKEGRRLAKQAVRVADRVDAEFFGSPVPPDLLGSLRMLSNRDAKGRSVEGDSSAR